MLVKVKFIYLFLIFSLELYEMRAQNAGVKVAISKSEEHELEGGSGFSSGSTDLLGFGADSFSNCIYLGQNSNKIGFVPTMKKLNQYSKSVP
ncbi:MAG: hypothetical protein IPI99_04405 [Saprospiraceae bacterium]|nr:hypothetical protein [Saprospiraceae bacterium]